MSKTAKEMEFENIKNNFKKGLWGVNQLKLAVKLGRITQEQMDLIVAEAE